MTAIQAYSAGDPRVSPALSSHLERHRTERGRLVRALDTQGGISPALAGVRRAAGVVLDWPIRSQRRALRNAMLASTMLLERRIERDEVETYLRSLEGGHAAETGADQA